MKLTITLLDMPAYVAVISTVPTILEVTPESAIPFEFVIASFGDIANR